MGCEGLPKNVSRSTSGGSWATVWPAKMKREIESDRNTKVFFITFKVVLNLYERE